METQTRQNDIEFDYFNSVGDWYNKTFRSKEKMAEKQSKTDITNTTVDIANKLIADSTSFSAAPTKTDYTTYAIVGGVLILTIVTAFIFLKK